MIELQALLRKIRAFQFYPAQAINISGGINPRSDSEAKNTPNR